MILTVDLPSMPYELFFDFAVCCEGVLTAALDICFVAMFWRVLPSGKVKRD